MKRVYLDNAAAALPSTSQLNEISEYLKSNPAFANPHSRHVSGRETQVIIDNVRAKVLQFFNCTSNDYHVIFTSNTSHGLDLIARLFDYRSKKGQNVRVSSLECVDVTKSTLLMFVDSHTSVLGMRAYCNYEQYVVTTYEELEDYLDRLDDVDSNDGTNFNNLFVFPAQSNFCGRKYDLDIMKKVKNKLGPTWDVCLDAAALVGTSSLDLSRYSPDFVVFSLYKLFGYPTGIGCLMVKKGTEEVIRHGYFGGGNVEYVSPFNLDVEEKKDLVERLECGTSNYTSITLLKFGFNDIQRHGGMKGIQKDTMTLAKAFTQFLKDTKHKNGDRIAVIYGKNWEYINDYNGEDKQGPVVNFNLLRVDGSVIGFVEVEKMADLYGIELRTGCMCNQGACSSYLGITEEDRTHFRRLGKECGDEVDVVDGRPLGSVRVSFGRDNTMEDVEWIQMMIKTCFLSSDLSLLNSINNNNAPKVGELKSISLYPVKSGGELAVDAWKIGMGGLEMDRQFMVVGSDGVPLTQRKYPSMCFIGCKIDKDNLTLFDKQNEANTLKINLNDHNNNLMVPSKVCVNNMLAIDCGEEASKWLASLSFPSDARLLRLSEDNCESTKQNFSNQADYLLINKASIKYLCEMTSVDYNELEQRFRANFVADFGSYSEFVEDKFKKIYIGSVEFEVIGKCTRCQMICIDQKTGQKDPNILKSLKDFRCGTGMTFGIYLKQAQRRESRLVVGQKIYVQEVHGEDQ